MSTVAEMGARATRIVQTRLSTKTKTKRVCSHTLPVGHR